MKKVVVIRQVHIQRGSLASVKMVVLDRKRSVQRGQAVFEFQLSL